MPAIENKITSYHGHYRSPGSGRIGIIASRFNETIVEKLIEGAVDGLVRNGVSEDDIDIIRAPGAFELPIVTKCAIQRKNYVGCIGLATVIRGATSHYDYVCSICANGLSQVALETGIPVMFGVLTTENIEQAVERSGTKAGNKGFEAALALLETIDVMRAIQD